MTTDMKNLFTLLVLLVLTCLLGNSALAQTRSASNTSFTHEVYDFSNIQATTTTVWTGSKNFDGWSGDKIDIANNIINVSVGDVIRVIYNRNSNNNPGGAFKEYNKYNDITELKNGIRWSDNFFEATVLSSNVANQISNGGISVQAAYMTITSVQVISTGSLTWNGNNLIAFAGNSLPKTDRISVNNTSGYTIGISDANNCSYLQSTTQGSLLYINNLNVGDIVRIWCAGECRILTDNTAIHDSNDPLVWNHIDPDPNYTQQGNYGYDERAVNNREGVQLTETFNYDVNNPSPTANELKIVNNHDDGTLVIRLAQQWAGIIKIEINAVQTTPRYDYDASLEIYDMYATTSSNGAYTANESADFKLNNEDAYYLKFTNNDLSLNERIAIDKTNTWTFAHGIQASSNWSNLSICNLREGDRVLIYYTGDAPVFSSNGKDGGYTGSAAFMDTWNDGMFDVNEGDHEIKNGDPVEYSYCRKEGAFGNEENYPHIWLYTSYPYVMMENGHLDLALSNGNHTRIVKVKIFSDHQAMMVDDYDNETYTYTAYYNITGELQAKEHIVPGGLEVHVGNDDADQHANVVFSKEGPVSYVKAVDGYKIPGIYRDNNNQIQNNFNLANEAPTTGTYYRFIPEANGQMTIRFKATSLNYYRWDLKADDIYYNTDTGGGWTTEFDRSNEWPMDRSCPYYLMVQDGDNYSSASFKIDNSNDLSSGAFNKNNEYCTLTLEVEAGKTYYLYGTWDRNTNDGNNIGGTDANLTQRPACGIAELLWVKFNPENKIYPLAKWVPNNTSKVNDDTDGGVPNPDTFQKEYELATVIGYVGSTITVKKMSGNITACRPYIKRAHPQDREGKLMIDGIQFASNKNPGGTILIKIGNPELKTSPLYALTIAYSTDPKYNGENGKTGDEGRGHTWDLSTNSLYGMEWDLAHNAYVKSQAPQYNTTFNTSTGGYATPTPYGTYFKDYYANEASIANYSSTDDVLDWFKNNNEINTGSLLEEEIDYPDPHGNIRSDWIFNYNLVYGDKLYDPIFSNKYDMEGDNADMIWDTEGTVIRTSANQSVIFNEFTGDDIHSSSKDPNRYVGILEGGEFRIPWLMPNDRVIIYMGTGTGRYADEAKFSIRGAYDAVYNVIDPSDDYVVGGSQWNSANSDNNYRGCYHFFAKGDGNGGPADMVFKMTSGSLCKLYKIQIYRGDRIYTNEIEGDAFYQVSTKNSSTSTKSTWTLKYFGKDEQLANYSGRYYQMNDISASTGKFASYPVLTNNTNEDGKVVSFSYTGTKGDIGTIRVRAKDMEKNLNFVADFAEHNVTIAYQEAQSYPYTWDFTDVNPYSGSDVANEWTINNNKVQSSIPVDSHYNLALWDDNGSMRVNSQAIDTNGQDNIFESNSEQSANQLWAKHGTGNEATGIVIPETQGLWFYMDNNAPENNGKMRITSEGLTLEAGENGWCNKVVVPDVPAGGAVYLRMKSTSTSTTPVKKYKFGTGDYTEIAEATNCRYYEANDNSGDYIVAIMNTADSKANLTLALGGFVLKKMAVSTDFKTVNKYGWATESRDHVIDPSLTSELTGYPFEHYIVTDVDYPNRTVEVTTIGKKVENNILPVVMPIAQEDGQQAYIIRNMKIDNTIVDKDGKPEPGRVHILNNGFHLFVPDMHDYVTNRKDGLDNLLDLQNVDDNLLRARLNGDLAQKYTGYGDNEYNYVMTTSTTNIYTEANTDYEDVVFARVTSKGMKGGKNVGYLPIDCTEPAGATAKNMRIVFASPNEVSETVETTIEMPLEEAFGSGAVYYNLNGQKIDGRPTEGGIYIMNGKKVVVK